jgi:large subunit ribosomal protein L21
MYAVVEDRNQQYRFSPGDRVLIDHHAGLEPGGAVTFDKVCLIGGDGDARVGAPYVDGASVSAKVVRQGVKGPKLVVAKYRRRKNSRKRTGFRATFTEVQIEAIHGA